MRTTLDLPDPLFREVKARAASEGMKLKELLAQYVEAGLRGDSAAPKTPGQERRGRLPVAIRRNTNIPLVPALTNRDINALLDEADEEGYLRVVDQTVENS
jgi:hypothetical protein